MNNFFSCLSSEFRPPFIIPISDFISPIPQFPNLYPFPFRIPYSLEAISKFWIRFEGKAQSGSKAEHTR
jgi:hypothetical protein